MKRIFRKVIAPVVTFAAALAILQLVGRAATLPTGFSEALIAGGLTNPTAMAFAPDGRLFVCLQGGELRVIKNDTLLAAPFVTVTVDQNGERGLLGVAFDPAFAKNHFVYVYYTATSPTIHNRISRFTANGDVAVAGSETILLDLDDLGATNHNGGAIHFGPDGKLYAGVGENAVSSNSQTLANLLGKMLRINADGSIPTSNPFYSQASGKNRAIWALGLRNPFTFAFQAGGTRMFINDVGQSTWEEVDEGIAGANYGWPTTEGPTTDPRFVSPLYAYQHASGTPTGCAIVGGAFYTPAGPQFPSEYYGTYFFADLCAGWIYRLDLSGPSPVAIAFASGLSSPVDLELGPDASLYVLERGGSGGTVSRIAYGASQAPVITQQPSNQTVAVGQQATFRVTASGGAPLSYQWQRNGSNVVKANAPTYTTPAASAADNGARFRCIVTNFAGSVTSNEATLTVTTGSTAPPPPTNLAATAGNTTVGLSWTASSGATSYTVLRSTSSKGPYSTIASGVTITSYTDTGLTNGVTYYYVVRAVSSGGTSANSNQASATPH